MIRYTNYVSTPFGRECSIKEVKNDEYVVLLKFIQAKDYLGFYFALNELIKETVPDFDEYNIIEKAYVYLAMCFYSVHNTVITENTVLGSVEYSVGHFFESIDSSCSQIPSTVNYQISPEIIAELTIPTRLLFTHTEVNIDYSTGLKKIKDIELKNEEERINFFRQISPKLAMRLEKEIKKQFSANCNLFNNLSVNLIQPDIFYFIPQVYAESLDDHYEVQYYVHEYLKWSWETYAAYTPIETRILFNQFKIDKERQAQERQQSLNN